VKPVRVNVIIRDETSSDDMENLPSVISVVTAHYNGTKKNEMTNNITLPNLTNIVPSYLSILNWHDTKHNLPQQES
jgi:hypothetical protein